jgi:branched-chain amino acid transport system substrate-binding protein
MASKYLFPWIFNVPATYWDGASAFIRHAADVEGGFDKIKGKKIGLVYLDVPYGKEPIPLLQALAQDYGFELKLYAVPVPQMQNQSSLWLDIRRDRLDWIYLQGWGAESDRHQGSDQDRIPDEPHGRRVVVGER